MIGTKQQIQEWLINKDETTLFEITQKREKTIRSLSQNRFYWGYVVEIIGNFHGMTAIETHLAIKQTFKIETTTDLSTSEFKTLIEMIQELWKLKFGVTIPNPKDIQDEESLFKSLEF